MSFGKDSGDPPQPPSAQSLVAAQNAQRISVNTPEGSATYGTPTDSLTISESPALQTQRARRETLSGLLYDPAAQIASSVSGAGLNFDDIPRYVYGLNYGAATAKPGVVQAGNLVDQSGNAVANNIQYGVDPSRLDAKYALPGNEDYQSMADSLEQATAQRALNRVNPEFQTDRQRLEQQLTDRGIPTSSAAGMAELDRMERAQNDARENIALSSVAAGRQEQGRLFGQTLEGRSRMFGEDTTVAGLRNQAQQQAREQASDAAQQQLGLRGLDISEQLQSATLQNAARQQALNEQVLAQNQPLNVLQGISGNTPSFQLPNFPAPQSADVLGANQLAYQGALNAYNQQQQNQQTSLGGLFGLAGTLGGAALRSGAGAALLGSDRRFKEGIRRVGRLDNGLPVYLFRYRGDPRPLIGLMADDVELVAPEAVHLIEGFQYVDYERAVAHG